MSLWNKVTMTTLKASPLRVESFRFEELNIAPVADVHEAPAPGAVDADFDFFIHPTEPERFAVGLSIKLVASPRNHYDQPIVNLIHARAVGYFRATEAVPEPLPRQLAANGLAILYGILRGVMATSMAWFDCDTILPGVNFTQLLAEKAAVDEDEHLPTSKEVLETPVRAVRQATSRPRRKGSPATKR